jgi:hypothetical protein
MAASELPHNFAPSDPGDRVREGDRELVRLVRTFLSVGASREPTLRLFRVYADSLRCVVKAEAELYESEIEQRLRSSGLGERELLEFSERKSRAQGPMSFQAPRRCYPRAPNFWRLVGLHAGPDRPPHPRPDEFGAARSSTHRKALTSRSGPAGRW